MKKRIVVIGTGGSIAARPSHGLDLVDYGAAGDQRAIGELLALIAEASEVAELMAEDFCASSGEALGPHDWLALSRRILELSRSASAPDGFVVVHGTSSLEEAAWFLDLTIGSDTPLVCVGAMRPFGTVGSDAGRNLLDAVRLAADDGARGRGVLVVADGIIHAARDATKVAAYALQAFAGGPCGALGMVAVDGAIHFAGPPSARPDALPISKDFPRIDVLFAGAGEDGRAVAALRSCGSRGFVLAAMAPGVAAPRQWDALAQAAGEGLPIIVCMRSGQDRVIETAAMRSAGFMAGGMLTPQKARILLMAASAAGLAGDDLRRCLDTRSL